MTAPLLSIANAKSVQGSQFYSAIYGWLQPFTSLPKLCLFCITISTLYWKRVLKFLHQRNVRLVRCTCASQCREATPNSVASYTQPMCWSVRYPSTLHITMTFPAAAMSSERLAGLSEDGGPQPIDRTCLSRSTIKLKCPVFGDEKRRRTQNPGDRGSDFWQPFSVSNWRCGLWRNMPNTW